MSAEAAVSRRARAGKSFGYIHKFRLEADDGGSIHVGTPITASESVGWLLIKFVAAVLALSATLAAGARSLAGW